MEQMESPISTKCVRGSPRIDALPNPVGDHEEPDRLPAEVEPARARSRRILPVGRGRTDGGSCWLYARRRSSTKMSTTSFTNQLTKLDKRFGGEKAVTPRRGVRQRESGRDRPSSRASMLTCQGRHPASRAMNRCRIRGPRTVGPGWQHDANPASLRQIARAGIRSWEEWPSAAFPLPERATVVVQTTVARVATGIDRDDHRRGLARRWPGIVRAADPRRTARRRIRGSKPQVRPLIESPPCGEERRTRSDREASTNLASLEARSTQACGDRPTLPLASVDGRPALEPRGPTRGRAPFHESIEKSFRVYRAQDARIPIPSTPMPPG